MKLLLIVHSDHYENDLNKCTNFNTVLAYHIKKEFESNNVECLVVPGESWLGIKKQKKSTWSTFERDFNKNLLKAYPNVLFVGAIPMKNVHASIIEFFYKNVTGVFGVCNEYLDKVHGDVMFFMLPDSSTENQQYIGPMYDSQYLYPDKQYKTLILHIDHYMQGRLDWAKDIKLAIQDLENNQYFKNHWSDYEVFYHSKKLNSINEFVFEDRPPNIPFAQLSEIYRKSHIGFVSHRETMGMYPIEMAASGTILATTVKVLPRSMYELINHVNYCENFWDTILPLVNQEQVKKNAEKVASCSYKVGAEKILSAFKKPVRSR